MSDGKNNLGLFAALFAGIFGITYGAYKATKYVGASLELERLRALIEKFFLDGKSEIEITNALIMLASEQMGDKFTEDVADRLKAWVSEEKIKLREQNNI